MDVADAGNQDRRGSGGCVGVCGRAWGFSRARMADDQRREYGHSPPPRSHNGDIGSMERLNGERRREVWCVVWLRFYVGCLVRWYDVDCEAHVMEMQLVMF